MRIFGHPLHPMLVHFPIAFWTLALVCDGCAFFGLAQTTGYASTLITLGVIIAIPTMLSGFIDLARLEGAATRDGNRHMVLMSLAWTFYLFALLTRLDGATLLPDPQPLSVTLSVFGFACLACGGWYGGQLVYHHGAGVRREH